MKKLLSLFIITVLIISTSSFTNIIPGHKHGNDKRIEVVFNRQLDFNDLVKIKMDLSQKGITINYKSLIFDENGHLQAIRFFVDCHDGFSGTAGDENLSNQSRVGFYRDYTPGTKLPFGTGGI